MKLYKTSVELGDYSPKGKVTITMMRVLSMVTTSTVIQVTVRNSGIERG